MWPSPRGFRLKAIFRTGSSATSESHPRLTANTGRCSGGLFLEAARYRACASRTAANPAICEIADGHLLRLRAVAFAPCGPPLQRDEPVQECLISASAGNGKAVKLPLREAAEEIPTM